MSEKIRNVDPARAALDVEQDAVGTPAVAVRNKATSGRGAAVDVQHSNASTAAIRVQGPGDLLDLRNSAGASVVRITQAGGLVAASVPPDPATGHYFLTASPAGSSTSSTLGVGTLRLLPWIVHRAITIDRIGAEVTSAGDAGSKLRLGIYADNGNGYPGALVLDAGTIDGDSATVQSVTISQALSPGLYWVGGAVQVVSVTQPTVRTINTSWIPPVSLTLGTSAPSAAANTLGFSQGSVTGALPSAFTTSVSASGAIPRVHVRVG